MSSTITIDDVGKGSHLAIERRLSALVHPFGSE